MWPELCFMVRNVDMKHHRQYWCSICWGLVSHRILSIVTTLVPAARDSMDRGAVIGTTNIRLNHVSSEENARALGPRWHFSMGDAVSAYIVLMRAVTPNVHFNFTLLSPSIRLRTSWCVSM